MLPMMDASGFVRIFGLTISSPLGPAVLSLGAYLTFRQALGFS